LLERFLGCPSNTSPDRSTSARPRPELKYPGRENRTRLRRTPGASLKKNPQD
jgi:hypothetical protein